MFPGLSIYAKVQQVLSPLCVGETRVSVKGTRGSGNGAGEAQRRGRRQGGRPPSLTQTARHAPPPRTNTSPLSCAETQTTVHTSTNDPHCRKPAHRQRRASPGGRPRSFSCASSTHRQTPAMSRHPTAAQVTSRNASRDLSPGTGKGAIAGTGPQHITTWPESGSSRESPQLHPTLPKQPPRHAPRQQQDGGKTDVLSSANGPSTMRCSKDVTSHQHLPGARPGSPSLQRADNLPAREDSTSHCRTEFSDSQASNYRDGLGNPNQQ
jgi:hypothetical protein